MHGRELLFSTVLFLRGFCSVMLADSASDLASTFGDLLVKPAVSAVSLVSVVYT